MVPQLASVVKVVYHSHLGAAALLHSCGILQELDAVIRAQPAALFKGKAGEGKRYDVVQQVQNTFFQYELERRGWLHQHAVAQASTGYYADFWKESPLTGTYDGLPAPTVRALCEVQFGNVSRLGSDFDKFRIGYLEERAEVGIEIVPMQRMAKRTDSSVANYEKALELVGRLKRTGLPVPVLLVGLDVDDSNVVDLRRHDKDLTKFIAKGASATRLALSKKVLANR